MKSWLDKTHPTIGSIWDFAKKYPALFLGLGTAVVSAVTVAFTAIQYCYEYGYYHYGNKVISSLIAKPQSTEMSTDFFVCVAFTCFFAIYTTLGRYAYRKRKYMLFLFVTMLVLFFLTSLLLPYLPITYTSMTEIIAILAAIFIVATGATILMNTITIVNCFFPTDEDKLVRTASKLISIEKKLSKSSKVKRIHKKLCDKRNRLDKKKREIEKSVEDKISADNKELRTAATRYHAKTIGAVAITLLIEFVICMPFATFFGYCSARENNNFTIVVNQAELCQELEQIVSADQEVNALAVLYRHENTVVVAPCYINEKEFKVYDQFQRVIDIDGLIFYQHVINGPFGGT